ncbi:hypothetical protein PVK06_027167 [Gossypium arboreum]|uniref:Aminotransferase-like plant mobile domain-containing protein n=1 Tax=Gossypium arboreum TaxID=29729 RepID=A0ABR0P2H0_GOSAR|nr:hypothetical protein PVK06_027167 [Gossypium arboreum]
MQLLQAEYEILETYIHNFCVSALVAIHGNLRDLGFLYTARMLRGTKLDPPLISALVARWRPKTHAFHLPYGECEITFEDVSLQLCPPVDAEVIRGNGECRLECNKRATTRKGVEQV